MQVENLYLAASIAVTASLSSIFRAVSSEGAQKTLGLETWRVMFCSLAIPIALCDTKRIRRSLWVVKP
jgi:hypothetical protein